MSRILPNVYTSVVNGGLSSYQAPKFGNLALVGVGLKSIGGRVRITTKEEAVQFLGSGPICTVAQEILSVTATTLLCYPLAPEKVEKTQLIPGTENKGAGKVNLEKDDTLLEKANYKLIIRRTGELGEVYFDFYANNILLIDHQVLNTSVSLERFGFKLKFENKTTVTPPVTTPVTDPVVEEEKKPKSPSKDKDKDEKPKEETTVKEEVEVVASSRGIRIDVPMSSFVDGDVYEIVQFFDAQAKVVDVIEAFEKASTEQIDIEYIAYCGNSDSVLWNAIKVVLDKAEEKNRFLFAVFKTDYDRVIYPRFKDYVDYLEKERQKINDDRMVVLVSPLKIVSLDGSTVEKTPLGYFCGMISKTEQYLPFNRIDQGANTFPYAVDLAPEDVSDDDIERLYLMRYTSFRTFVGISGIYLTEVGILSSQNSDYDVLERRRVMNIIRREVRVAQLGFLNDDVESDSDGRLVGIELFVSQTEDVLQAFQTRGYFTKYKIEIDKNQKFLINRSITTTLSIQPKTKLSFINMILKYFVPSAQEEA